MYKDNRQGVVRLPAGHELRAMDSGSDKLLKAEHIIAMWRDVQEATCKSNILVKPADKQSEIPSVEDALHMYHEAGFCREDWHRVHGNALKARKDGNTTPLQMGILTYGPDMCDIIKALDDARPIVKKLDAPGKHFVTDFKQDSLTVHTFPGQGRSHLQKY